MDALTDTLAKHGVLASDKKPARRADGRFAPKPAPEPLWKSLKKGDLIEITKAPIGESTSFWINRAEGIFQVVQVDHGTSVTKDLRILTALRNDKRDERGWISTDRVVRVVTDEPKSVEPAWRTAKIGDFIRVAKGGDHDAGTFEVTAISDSASSSAHLAVKYKHYSRWWIANDKVLEIVEKPAKTLTPAEQAKVGDWIRMTETYDTPAGVYEVAEIDPSATGNYRVRIFHGEDGRPWWIPSDKVMEIVSAPEIDLKAIAVGDKLRVTESNWFDAGTYEVITTSSGDSIEIKTPRGDWYVGSSRIQQHFPKAAPATSRSETTPLDLASIKAIQKGERVRVKGSRYVDDGEHEVISVDRHDNSNTLQVKDVSRGSWWISNDHVFAVIKKPEVSVADDAPAYLKAKLNDMVRVENSGSVEDGVYRVMDIDEGDSMRLQVDDDDGGAWVHNDYIKEIVTSAPATTRDAEAYKKAKVGDTVRVAGYRDDYKPGNYVVITAEPDSYDGEYNLEVQRSERTGDTTWVRNKDVLEVIAGTEPVKDAEAFRRAKVGDTIRVSRGTDHPAGEYVVTQISEGAGHRLAVDYNGRNDRIWWVRNSVVEAVVTTRQGAVAVRGNCLIHVDVPTIMSNRSNNRHEPVIVARRLASIGTAERFRELAWDGPSRFVHHHFQRIEGTDIQNWVETDAPLTAWKPDGAIDVLNPIPGTVLDDMRAMTKPILGAFVIHIAAPVLARNRKEGRNDPVIAVRMAHTNWATDVLFARKVEWNGPSRMVHRPSTPIPGTEGRGVSFVETDADVTVYLDNEEPIVLTMPPLRAAA